jgi:hypothetical protein
MTRPAIVIWDEDGVLYQWTPEFNRFCGWPADEQWETWDHYKTHGMTTDQFKIKLDEFAQSGCFAKGAPHWDGIMAWHALKAHSRIGNVSITAKPTKKGFDDAAHWMRGHGIVMARHMSDDKTILHDTFDGREIFAIDDNVGHVEALLDKGVRAYVRDQPWNQHAAHLPRVFNALDFASLVYDYVEGQP